jgi:DNA-binding transcriptional LysR family regulator
MLAGLRCGDIDVIVGSVRHPPSVKDVYEEILYLEPVSLLARAGHPLMKKSDISISDLASFGWVVPRKGVPTRDYFESLFHKRDISPPADFVETDSLIATRALLVENDRLTIISPNRAYFELRIGLLDIVPFDVSELSFQFGYTVRAQDSPPPGISEFLAALKKVGSDQCADWDVTTGMPLAATNHPRPGRLG